MVQCEHLRYGSNMYYCSIKYKEKPIGCHECYRFLQVGHHNFEEIKT